MSQPPSPIYQKLMDPITRGSCSELAPLLDSLKLDSKSEKMLISQCFLYAVSQSSLYRFEETKEILNLLYSKGASVNFADSEGKTPLMVASEKGYIELIATLLEWRPNVDETDNFGRSALFFAIDSKAHAENEDIVSILAEKTCEKTLNLLTSDQKTCLSRAVENNFAKIARNLLAHQADPNIVVRSAGFEAPALFIAIRNRNFEIVEALIEFGADVSARNKEGCSVFEGLEPELQERIKGFVEKYKRSEEKSLAALENSQKASCNNNAKGKPQQSGKKFEFFEEKEQEHEKAANNASGSVGSGGFGVRNINNNSNSNNNNYNYNYYGGGLNKSASGKGFTSSNNSNSNSNNNNSNKQINKNYGSVENLSPEGENLGFFQKKNSNASAYNFPQLLATPKAQFLVNSASNTNNSQQENLSSESQTKTSNYHMNMNMNINMNMNMNPPTKNSLKPKNFELKPQENNIMTQLGVPNLMNAMNAAETLNKNLNLSTPSKAPPTNSLNSSKFPMPAAAANNPYFLNNNNNNINSITSSMTLNPININGGIRTSHYDSSTNKKTVSLTLNLNDNSSIEYLKNHADKLCSEHKERKLIEDLAEKHKKIEFLEKVVQDLRQNLKKLTDEKDKIQKEFDKLKKNCEIQRTFCEKATNTEEISPCKVEFSDFLNSADLSQHPKVKRSYQNFISNSKQIEVRLHEEIVEFQRNVEKFNQDNSMLFQKLIKLVAETITSAIPDATVQTYGSFATELCLPHSDIDLVIECKYNYQYQNADYRAIVLGTIEETLKKASFVSETKNIPAATVPVLKVICTEEFLKKRLDITVKDGNHNGLSCVLLVKKYIKRYAPLKPLVLVLKYMLYHLDLADTYQGGLNSYGLILMIVSMLQSFLLHNLNDEIFLNNLNLGGLLIRFFHLFGWELDYFLNHIKPNEPENNNQPVFGLRDENQYFTPYQTPIGFFQEKLVIVDPNNPTNNVGRCTKNINLIKKAFFIACIALHENVCVEKEHVHFNSEATLINQQSCCILKKIFFLPYMFLKCSMLMMETTG